MYKFTDKNFEGVRANNLAERLPFIDFSKAINSMHRGKMEQIQKQKQKPKIPL